LGFAHFTVSYYEESIDMSLKFIEGLQTQGAERFESLHSVRTVTGDSKQLITLTGVVRIDLKGTSTESWRQEEIIICPRIVYIGANQALELEHWAPFVTINGVYNEKSSNDAGWAVNNFELLLPYEKKVTRRYPHVEIKTRVLVRDTDGWLLRLGYQVTMSGKLVEWVDIPA